MNPISLAQDIVKQLQNVEGRTAMTALEIAKLTIDLQMTLTIAVQTPDYVRTVAGEPLVP